MGLMLLHVCDALSQLLGIHPGIQLWKEPVCAAQQHGYYAVSDLDVGFSAVHLNYS